MLVCVLNINWYPDYSATANKMNININFLCMTILVMMQIISLNVTI